jgi:hypothetical protein
MQARFASPIEVEVLEPQEEEEVEDMPPLEDNVTTVEFVSNTDVYVRNAAHILENLMICICLTTETDAAHMEFKREIRRQGRELREVILARAGESMLASFNLWMTITYPNMGAVSFDD